MSKQKRPPKELRTFGSAGEFAISIGVSDQRNAESKLKAKLVAAIRKEMDRQHLSHQAAADRAGVARTNITGIMSGSVTSVTLDRLVRIATSLGLSLDLTVKRSLRSSR